MGTSGTIHIANQGPDNRNAPTSVKGVETCYTPFSVVYTLLHDANILCET